MDISLIDLKAQYDSIKEKITDSVMEVISSANYIMGKNVLEFEKEFSDYLGVKNSVSVGNGTDALIIALKALGIKEGDEVITTPYTFFATAESISAVGAKPVFVDVNISDFNIDVESIESKITKKTKAIMVVHIFGNPADMDEIMRLSKLYGLYVIEDACQAIGSQYKGKKVGTIGHVACFSFFPTKNLGGMGDGGMIVTNNDDIAVIAKALRTHGSGKNGERAYNLLNNIDEEVEKYEEETEKIYDVSKYYNYLIGHNSRLDEIQASILRIKLSKIDYWNKKRIQHAQYYRNQLSKIDYIQLPNEDIKKKHVYHMFILQSNRREQLINYLKGKGIDTGIYYPVPLHLQKVYCNLGYKLGDMPNAEYLSKRTFAIPIYAEIDEESKKYIVDAIKTFK